MEEKRKGILLAVIGASSYGVQPLFTRLAIQEGMSSNAVLVYRFVFIFFLAGGYLLFRRRIIRPSGRQWAALIVYGAGGYGAAIFLLAECYKYLSTGRGTMIHCSYTAFVALYMILFFKEKMTGRKGLALCLTCLSVLLLMDFSEGTQPSLFGVSIALLSGAAFASYMVSVDRSALKSMDAFNLMLYLSVAILLVFGIPGIANGSLALFTLSWTAYAYVFAIALLSIVGIGLMTLSIRLIGPAYAAMISIFEPVVNLLCSFLILKEAAGPLGAAGSMLMLVVLLIIAGEGKPPVKEMEREGR